MVPSEGGLNVRILLATDGSRAANVASDLVAAMRWPAGSVIRIVSVVPGSSSLGMDASEATAHLPELDRYRDPLVRSHVVALADAERDLGFAHPGAVVERFLLRGRAASLIVQEARDFAADLIVVGHRGRGPIETMLLGSVSAEVAAHAPCAVLVARSASIGSIVFADDDSPGAKVAAAVLGGLPLPTTTPATVVTVADDAFPYETAVSPALYSEALMSHQEGIGEARQDALTIASAGAARLEQRGFPATALVRTGDPAHEIVTLAAQHHDALVVLGTRGHSGLRRLLLGSVARNVLIHAPCSVLIVRETVVPPAGEDVERAAVAAR
jgi:nucleotide-binding universal stress UspA family protein